MVTNSILEFTWLRLIVTVIFTFTWCNISCMLWVISTNRIWCEWALIKIKLSLPLGPWRTQMVFSCGDFSLWIFPWLDPFLWSVIWQNSCLLHCHLSNSKNSKAISQKPFHCLPENKEKWSRWCVGSWPVSKWETEASVSQKWELQHLLS